MMSILLITGDHKRHIFFANFINKVFKVNGIIIEKREKIIPIFKNIKNLKDKKNAKKHFNNRFKYEKLFFNHNGLEIENTHFVQNLNDDYKLLSNFINNIKPEIVILFGTSVIKDPLFSILPNFTLNLHFGLAPYFKGTACNFWPFYFLTPNLCGCTFHFINKKLDSGKVIHHTLSSLQYGDSIHEVSCKTLLKACSDVLKIIDFYKIQKNIEGVNLSFQGKLFLNSDFTVEKLRIIYNLFNDDIVDHYLKGDFPINTVRTVKI